MILILHRAIRRNESVEEDVWKIYSCQISKRKILFLIVFVYACMYICVN